MNTQPTSFRSRKVQLGVTVIELMVALLLGILLTGGAIQLFVSNRATYGFNEGFARLQENGRFALDALSYHTRLAGYLGCLSNVPRYNHLGSPTALAYDFEDGLAGVEATGTNPGQTFDAPALDPPNSTDDSDWVGGLPAGLLGSVIEGSDVLIVRHGSTTSHTLLSPFTTSTVVTAVAATTDYSVGDIAIVSDCQKATIFQITSVASTAGGIDIEHVGGVGAPRNLTATWTTDEEYGAGAQLLKGETWVFYVGARAGGPPALFQRRLLTNSGATSSTLVAEELVEGVETMQVRYGIDAAQDGTIDSYVTANNVANWEQVAAVRVSLLVRSPEEYGTEVDDDNYVVDETIFNPINDRRIRQVFTATIAIRNRLP